MFVTGAIRPAISPSLGVVRPPSSSLAEAAGLESRDRFAPTGFDSVKKGALAGVSAGAAYGTVVGGVLGSVGAIGGMTWVGASVGSGMLGLPGLALGAAVGLAAGVAEEKYLHVGASLGGYAGLASGAVVGGAIGAVIGGIRGRESEG